MRPGIQIIISKSQCVQVKAGKGRRARRVNPRSRGQAGCVRTVNDCPRTCQGSCKEKSRRRRKKSRKKSQPRANPWHAAPALPSQRGRVQCPGLLGGMPQAFGSDVLRGRAGCRRTVGRDYAETRLIASLHRGGAGWSIGPIRLISPISPIAPIASPPAAKFAATGAFGALCR